MSISDTSVADGSALEPMVRKLEYLKPFDPADRAALLALPHQLRTLQPQHYIIREMDRTSVCCVLLSGFAVRHKIVGTGHRQIIAIHMRGEIIDLHNSLLGTADHSIQMLTRGHAAFVSRDDILRIAYDRPQVGKAMWFDTLVDGSITREWVANVGRREARARIAHLLCEFALRLQVAGLGDQSNYELPMTQEQLGDATGLTPVHVNRTIRGLEADGLIERLNPRSIGIGNWRKLADVADFNSNYLHLREDEPALRH